MQNPLAIPRFLEFSTQKLPTRFYEDPFYFTTGDSDFLLISEVNDAESIIASLLAASAAGTISDVTTARAWTGAEFKAIADKASKAASAYRVPGKS
jgi:hypothetical protein